MCEKIYDVIRYTRERARKWRPWILVQYRQGPYPRGRTRTKVELVAPHIRGVEGVWWLPNDADEGGEDAAANMWVDTDTEIDATSQRG